MENFNEWQVVLLMLVIGYTIVLGAKNTFYKVVALFGIKSTQSSAGQLMDIGYYTCIGYLCYVGGYLPWLS